MRKALVVGINAHSSSPLRGCVDDAISIASTFAIYGNSLPNFVMQLRTALSDSLTRVDLRAAADKLCDVPRPNVTNRRATFSANWTLGDAEVCHEEEAVFG
jgi:hypothetical protein